jgi:DNA polymerase sliding clamp subunit (PCNA homolog)
MSKNDKKAKAVQDKNVDVTINTDLLQSMVAKIIKAPSNHKMLPVTNLIGVEVENGILSLSGTDGNNTMLIKSKERICEDEETFYVSVEATVFAKIVAKTTTQTVSLKMTEKGLLFMGNGTYTIEIPLDENGKVIRIPMPDFSNCKNESELKTNKIKRVVAANGKALASTVEIPELLNYYVDDKHVITSDRINKACISDIPFTQNPQLLTPQTLQLLTLFDGESITCAESESSNIILFFSDTMILVAYVPYGLKNFPVETLLNYKESAFESSAVLDKAKVLKVLERLSLFVKPYDNNTCVLTFNRDDILATTRGNSGEETIKYLEITNHQPYVCHIDIVVLAEIVNAITEEKFTIWFGNDSAIKITYESITQIISLSE